MVESWSGGCLCGSVRFVARGRGTFRHLCSCTMCRKWSGAFTVAWAEFPVADFVWTNELGLTFYQSSAATRRGFCNRCGSTICAIDDGYDRISVATAVLDDGHALVPGKTHSFAEEAPEWWTVSIVKN